VISAVFIFALLNVLFEYVLLCMLPPRTRLRVLGSSAACNALHVAFLTLNLVVHWGTLIGTMASVAAFLCSMLTVQIARTLFGHITGTMYTRGWIQYPLEDLR
jgi:hypothetical protein